MSRARLGAWVAAALLAAPAVALAQGETIAEIRVHGNYTTPDDDVLTLSGLRIGVSAQLRPTDRPQRRALAREGGVPHGEAARVSPSG